MRPSFSVSLEPGLERGVPWGRDLFTFVTSAAGHMMRTLQKPRKSRPSKRQVNHRRFLHNMIQRKFADIEASNHRLASALYAKEGEKTTSPAAAHGRETLEPSGDQQWAQTVAEGNSDSRSVKRVEDERPWKRQQKSTSAAKRNSHSKTRQTNEKTRNKAALRLNDKDIFQEAELPPSEYPSYQSEITPVNLTENHQLLPLCPDFTVFAQTEEYNSPPFSPELSPLSLDSGDFSAHMLNDLHESIADGLKDINEACGVGNGNSECYFESGCPCQADAGLEVRPSKIILGELSDDLTIHPDGEESECSYEHSCEEDRGWTADCLQHDPRSSLLGPSTDRFSLSHETHQLRSACTLEGDLTLTTFEGVAQSFPVPLHPHPHPEPRSIPTPPHEEDWLFPDILKDRLYEV